MIGISGPLSPCKLIHNEGVSEIVRSLLKEAQDACEEQDWERANGCAENARKICLHSGDNIGRGLALIHLADFYCEAGELGQALEQCEAAYHIFKRQLTRAQRHNQAVTAYSLAYLHQLRPFSQKDVVLHWYDEASMLFEEAKAYWASFNDVYWFGKCREACKEMTKQRDQFLEEGVVRQPKSVQSPKEAEEKRRVKLRRNLTKFFSKNDVKALCSSVGVDYDDLHAEGHTLKVIELIAYLDRQGRVPELLAEARNVRPDIPWLPMRIIGDVTASETTPHQTADFERVTFDIWRPDSTDSRFVRYKPCQAFLIDKKHASINDTLYRLLPIQGDETPPISNANYHFMLPVAEDLESVPSAQEGDFLFVRLQWPIAEEYDQVAIWKRGKGWLVVDFEWDEKRRFRLLQHPPEIIGGDPSKEVKGYFLALLKPE